MQANISIKPKLSSLALSQYVHSSVSHMLHYLHWKEKRRWGMPFPCNLICQSLHKALIDAVLIWQSLEFLQKITYGELLLTLLTQTNESWGTARLVTQMKARPADVCHSRQEEGTGRANSKELSHGKSLECFLTHSGKKGTPFPLFPSQQA